MKKYVISALIVLILATVWVLFSLPQTLGGSVADSSCSMSSVSYVAVGHQLSTEVLASKANRAYARIQQANNATNTAAVNFGADATLVTGLTLPNMFSSTTPVFVEVGLNADMPYTGSVEILTSTGSTTVQVIDCLY